MFNRSDDSGGRSRRRTLTLVGLSVLAVVLPITALSGLLTSDPRDGAAARTAEAKPVPVPGATYRIRCWQEGKLLFEENEVALPVDLSPYAIRIRGTDRKGGPLYVAETRNATCLVQVPTTRERLSTP